MTPHISPGQDCTINPIVIDDSKRSAKNPTEAAISFRCENCEDGGDVMPTVNTDLDWVLYCDSCGYWRYPTESELRDILCLEETGVIPEFVKPGVGEHP